MSEKGYNGLDAIASMTGITKEQSLKIFEQAKENLRRLDGCAGPHQFEPHEKIGDGPLIHSYKCRRCEGTLVKEKVHWYEIGLKHGRAA